MVSNNTGERGGDHYRTSKGEPFISQIYINLFTSDIYLVGLTGEVRFTSLI